MDIYRQDKISKERTANVKMILRNWSVHHYSPNYFLTLRLPKHRETEDLDYARESLRQILKKFEKELVGRNWHKHHLPFVIFAENHNNKATWHFHILFNSGKYSETEIKYAIYTTINHLKLSRYCLFLEYVNDTMADINNVSGYCVKEIQLKYYDILDSDRFITSHDLFNIPKK